MRRTRRWTGWSASLRSWRRRRGHRPRGLRRRSWWSRGRYRPHEP
ncbi:chaperone DnaK 1 domain protein [Mycobacterium avium MAV_120709_2344]|nr:chaperone DnaK 1 domain protein [Mycobacterium avium MAV_120709_2344]